MSAVAPSSFELAIGGSVAAEELKGEPGRAVAVATAALAGAGAHGPAGEAAARTDLGLALTLQGLPGAARLHLTAAMRTGGAEVALLAALYERMATCLRYNTFPNGQGAGGAEISARWNGVADEEAAAERLDALAGRVGSSPILAVRRLTGLITALAAVRSSLDLLWSVPDPPPGLLDQVLPSLLALEQEPAVPAGWVAFGRLGAADACRRAGEPARAQELLAAALEAYAAAGDAAGQGVCHLAGADWLAAPFSSPVDLNLAVRESASEGSDLDWRVEAAESGEEGMDLDGARAGYDLAAARFAEAAAPRGLAAVELRHSYLAVLAADYERAAGHAGASRDRFTAAGDTAGASIAAIHQALARIGAGALAEDRAAAGAVGAWGAGDGSFSVALGLGLLCGRVGRHWRLRRGDPERALACYRLAAAVHEALGARLNLAQSLVDQADVLRGVGSAAQAGAQYELAVEVTEAASDGPAPVGEVARRRGLLVAVKVLQDHHARQDPDGMERASIQVARRLEAAPPGPDPAEQAIAGLARWLLAQLPTAVPLARAMALRERGYAEEASPFFEQALASAGETAQDTGVRHLLEASVLASQERFAEAIDRYRRYAAVRDGPDGDAALVRALGAEQQRRVRRNGLEQDFAFLTRVRSWIEAQAAADACQALAGDQWWAEDERPWRVLSDLGEVQEGLGRLEPALDHYEQAMRVFEARRGQLANAGLRASLGGSRDLQWLALLGARCALRLADADPSNGGGALARAFGIVERGKARALLDLMARSVAFTAGRPGDPPALRRWRELGARTEVAAQLLEQRRRASAGREELEALERRLAAEQRALREQEGELTRTEPGWLGGVRATGGGGLPRGGRGGRAAGGGAAPVELPRQRPARVGHHR